MTSPAPRTNQGTRLHKLRAGDLELSETRYSAGLDMPRHGHELAYLTCVLEGSYDERIGAQHRTVYAPSLLLHPPDEDHAVRFGGTGARILGINLGHRTVRRLREEAAARSVFERWTRTPEANWILARLVREFRRPEAAPLAVEGLTLELIASGLRPAAKPGSRSLERAREFLRANFAQSVTLEMAAQAAEIHPVSLARGFRRAFGTTVGDYVRELRVTRASELIADTEIPLVEIALECGFADQAHLTRVFRASTGLTPGAYRKSHQL